MTAMYMPGATAVGITYNGGLVLASERRIAYGNFVVSKTTKKTFVITPHVGAACAGLVADMQILSLQVSALAKIRKMEIKRDVPPNTIAKMMSNMMYERRFFPLLTQVIVGGLVDSPVIFTLDPLGSVLPDDYAAVGTGAEMALGILDQQYKKELNEAEATDLAVKSIRAAIMRDSASGDNIDVLVIDKNGIKETTKNVN
jgi:proteasome beta subunit